jgi:tight adherence protein C
MSALGALVGLSLGLGLWLLFVATQAMRTPRLAERIAPFVRDASGQSQLLAEDRVTPFGILGKILAPITGDLATIVDRFLGGQRAVRRRLAALGLSQSVDSFRIEQVIWGIVGAIVGILGSAVLFILNGSIPLIGALLLTITGLVTGVLGRDWWLTRQVKARENAMMAEFPVVAELLALAVTAGEAPIGALDRVTRLCRGELSREMRVALAEARAGMSFSTALQALTERTTLDSLARFVDGIIIALERGTPLAEVLRAQAADVREASKRQLLATGGRRELLMMVPVVFLILPITVLFALYPGLVHITLLTR